MNYQFISNQLENIPRLFSIVTLYAIFCTAMYIIPYYYWFGIQISNYASLTELSFWALESIIKIITSFFFISMFNQIINLFKSSVYPDKEVFGAYFNTHKKKFTIILTGMIFFGSILFVMFFDKPLLILYLIFGSFFLLGIIYSFNAHGYKDSSRFIFPAIIIPILFFLYGAVTYHQIKSEPSSFSLISTNGEDMLQCESSLIGTTSTTIFLYNLEMKQTEIIPKSVVSKIILYRK